MRVRRFEGKNEEAILAQIRDEMGEKATVVSTREKPYSFPMSLFRKPKLVVTAAYEEDTDFPTDAPIPPPSSDVLDNLPPMPEISSILQAARETAPPTDNDSMEESLTLLLQEARKATLKTEEAKAAAPKKKQPPPPPTIENEIEEEPADTAYDNPLLQTVYDKLLEQDVLPEVANQLLSNVTDEADLKQIMASVYASIIKMLRNPQLINTTKNNPPQAIVFMGPTGVGKTTTIAKLSSVLSLQHELRVGLITADTYRIAAVEQLRTYADILGLDIRTVYKPNEMATHTQSLIPNNDIVLIDTAGRSHKNQENLNELKEVLTHIPEATHYLVLSVATRYKELANIVNTYANITDFNIIFTKLDESDTLGNLVNLCCLTGKKPAYITFGQSVPEDFDAVKPDAIAKSLLGLGNNAPWQAKSATPAGDAHD